MKFSSRRSILRIGLSLQNVLANTVCSMAAIFRFRSGACAEEGALQRNMLRTRSKKRASGLPKELRCRNLSEAFKPEAVN